jgi:ribulose-phosphate 3-epimerase
MATRPITVTPSILSADFRCLEKEVKDAEAAGADRIHCDVMDGHFVPNLTFGPFVIEAVKKCVSIPLDVHLMIANPQKYIANYCDAGADVLTVHAEVCGDELPTVLAAIRKQGARAGACVNPDKSVNLLLPFLRDMDQALVMTVFAGFSGQKFMADMLPKVKAIADEAKTFGLALDIQVDGGITEETAKPCAECGANVFVAGSYVFGAGRDNYRKRMDAIRSAAAGPRRATP